MFTNQMLAFLRCYLNDELKKTLWITFKDDFDRLYSKIKEKKNILLDVDNACKEMYAMLSEGYEFLTIDDIKYPILLKQIRTAPVLLSARGNIGMLDVPSIAVVGSREIEIEDFSIIRAIIDEITSIDFYVISGLAVGTDSIAHTQSIDKGTISVMPCGLGRCYPHGHEFLVEKIVEMDGLILSEYPFDRRPEQRYFVQRNRIIVGISDAIVVCRAREIKCGTMSSVAVARKINRSIYTYNFSGKSDGNKYLLRNNIASLITNLEDLKCRLLIDKVENDYISEEYSKYLQERYKESELREKNANNCNNYVNSDIDNNIKKALFDIGNDDNICGNSGDSNCVNGGGGLSEISIQTEIANIVKYMNYKTIKSKDIPCIFEICRKKMKISDKDILLNLIEMYL